MLVAVFCDVVAEALHVDSTLLRRHVQHFVQTMRSCGRHCSLTS
eukprot:SAG31_NODE_23194_length_509_cov_0.873171_2_plen_43_part_01